jgi:serine/threonine-protein kinase HipA
MKHRCLYCYEEVEGGLEFHRKCSMEFFGTPAPPKINYSLDEMDELAKNIIQRSIAVPGVQPKLSMSLIKATKENSDTRLTVVGALGGQYIFKPPSDKFLEMPANEHLTMRMAESFGIRVVPSSLIRLSSGELSYITKRIDRKENGEKIHMIDMFQITEAFDKYKSSMEKVGKALDNYSRLNVAIVFPEDDEELALTLGGKKKKLKREHFERFGVELGLTPKQIKGSFNRMINHKSSAFEWIDKSFLSKNLKTAYKAVLETRYKQIEG